MTSFINIIKVLFSLLPLVIEAVKSIEAAFPAQGAGAAKLDAIKQTLQAAYNTATDVQVSFETLWQPLQAMVSGIVGIANATGLFNKGTSTKGYVQGHFSMPTKESNE